MASGSFTGNWIAPTGLMVSAGGETQPGGLGCVGLPLSPRALWGRWERFFNADLKRIDADFHEIWERFLRGRFLT